jgi:hypothetical protein
VIVPALAEAAARQFAAVEVSVPKPISNKPRSARFSKLTSFLALHVRAPDPDPTLRYYKATLRITPITTSGGSFVEWWSDFEATPEATLDWGNLQRREFAKSLALCRHDASAADRR